MFLTVEVPVGIRDVFEKLTSKEGSSKVGEGERDRSLGAGLSRPFITTLGGSSNRGSSFSIVLNLETFL